MAAYPSFPGISRAPALRTKTSSQDPTLRDTLDNGMESTRAKFTRRRREWSVEIEFLTNGDWRVLEQFVQTNVVYGAGIFIFPDDRDAQNPAQLTVRFSKIPTYTDAGWAMDEFRQHCTLDIREV